jgi:hypothetical protein
VKTLANIGRKLLFGAPLALVIGIPAAAFLATRGASGTAGPPPPPIEAGAILVVFKGDREPLDADGGARAIELESAVNQALAKTGHPVADARFMWDVLVNGSAPLNTGRIDTPIPSVWPGMLRPVWEQARTLCITQADPPPYNMGNLAGYLCGLKIAPVLWQTWLDHVHAEEVVVVDVNRTNPNDASRVGWNVEVSAYKPSSIDEHWLFRGEMRPEVIAEAAAGMAVRALGGEGRIIRRTLEREMPDSPQYHSQPAVALPNNGFPLPSQR